MEQGKTILQKIRKQCPSNLDMAMKYYGLISLLNNIHLTNRKIELMAFTAVKGSISAGGAREEFVKRFQSSKATVNNMIAELQQLKLMVKVGDKITVNPKIALDFNAPLSLEINLSADGTH